MNRVVHLVLTLFLFSIYVLAQNHLTEYYTLTNIYINGAANAQSGNSGQFITRVNTICYDSKKDGASVKNGTLELVNRQGTSSKYIGDCFYGNDCSYTFFDDKGVLNIQTPEGKIYVYKKATPPDGRTTCSLIKTHSSDGGSYGGGGYVAPPVNNGGTSNQRNGSTKTKHTCTVCGGKGRKIKETYSAGRFKYCAECGREVSAGHYHATCDFCSGTGYRTY